MSTPPCPGDPGPSRSSLPPMRSNHSHLTAKLLPLPTNHGMAFPENSIRSMLVREETAYVLEVAGPRGRTRPVKASIELGGANACSILATQLEAGSQSS